MKPPIKPSSYFKPHQLIDGTSFNKLIEHYDDINKTIHQFNIFDKATIQLSMDLPKGVSGFNLKKNIRLLWDYEIHKDACIESVPIIRQTDSMKSWVPYPMTDKGASYMVYKKARFNSPGSLGIYVSDELVSQLSSNDPIKPMRKDNKGIKRTNANKGGRPTDAKIKRKIDKLRTKYYDLRENQGLSRSDSLKKLKKEFPAWTLSTIETYLKK